LFPVVCFQGGHGNTADPVMLSSLETLRHCGQKRQRPGVCLNTWRMVYTTRYDSITLCRVVRKFARVPTVLVPDLFII
jgi:hypothetical protein